MKKKDSDYLRQTITLSKKCVPVSTAFCVGAVIVDENGKIVATGFSRETDTQKHAEEIAIEKALEQKKDLSKAILYSSLEPCGRRLSGRKTCVERILETGIKKVVFAKHEPSTFVNGEGEKFLQKADVEVTFLEMN